MSRIGIDARLINQTGVGRYTRNLLTHLDTILKPEDELYVYVMNEDFSSLTFQNPRIHVRKAHFMWHSFSEQLGFCLQLIRDNLDLMHFTYFSFPILYRKPFIITIHDLIPLKHATGKASKLHPFVYKIKHAGYRKALHAGVYQSTAIITPTQTVKDDILSRFPNIPADKMYVTYEGVGLDLLSCKPEKKAPYDKKYFMYVGNFYPHKNIVRLIEACACIKDDIFLILVGPEDYFAHTIRAAIHEHGQENRIIMRHDISDSELVTMYTHAVGLVHPSLDEGFGLQLIEASYFECPVIASDIPLFHEIMGERFVAFDPYDMYDIAAKLAEFLHKPQKSYLSRTYIEKHFSFEQMAHETYDIYRSFLNTSSK